MERCTDRCCEVGESSPLLLSGSWDAATLDQLPLSTLERMFAASEDVLDCACTVHQRGLIDATIKSLKKLSKKLKEEFKNNAKKASEDAAKAQQGSAKNQDHIDLQTLKTIGVLAFSLSQAIKEAAIEEAREILGAIWATGKEIAAGEASIKFSLGAVDMRAIRILNQHQVFWINNLYSDHLAERIRAVAREVIVQQGLTAAEKGTVLEKALKRELGVIKGGPTDLAPDVPARYAGNPGRYIDNVVHTAAHQARMFSTITAYGEASRANPGRTIGYAIDNPNDRRTGKICQMMSGMTFQISDGQNHMNRILSASSPRDVRAIAPWHSAGSLANILEDAERGSEDARQRLLSAGAVLPPFHLLCRSTINILTQ